MNAIGHSFQDDGELWICYADRSSGRPTDQSMARRDGFVLNCWCSFVFCHGPQCRFIFGNCVEGFSNLKGHKDHIFCICTHMSFFDSSCFTRSEASVDNNNKIAKKEESILDFSSTLNITARCEVGEEKSPKLSCQQILTNLLSQ